jgi:hypothetical protein
MHKFFIRKSFWQFFLLTHVTREKLPKQCLYEKFAGKMLMKLTPNVVFDVHTQLTINRVRFNQLSLYINVYQWKPTKKICLLKLFSGKTAKGNIGVVRFLYIDHCFRFWIIDNLNIIGMI